MRKITVNELSIGLLFRKGKFKRVLLPGTYLLFKGDVVEIADIYKPLYSSSISLEKLMQFKELESMFNLHVVKENQILVRFLNGKIYDAYTCGTYALYGGFQNERIKFYNTTDPKIKDMSAETIKQLPVNLYKREAVEHFEKGLLFVDNEFKEILDGGVYYFWNTGRKIEIKTVDARQINMSVSGQELLTQDKVNIRINMAVSFRVVDYKSALTEVEDYYEQIRLCAQLALRDFVGRNKLDDILEKKDEISAYVYEKLKSKEKNLFIELEDAGVKDIILPGEIRAIMNTILMAEKKAQANVITRREEVASTRSLLNTAKLMDENKTLYKLKELEFLEKICENVGNINLGSGVDIIGQLTGLLKEGNQ